MKIIVFVFIFFLIFDRAAVRLAAQTTTAAAPLSALNKPYQTGEKLTYNVSFSNFSNAGYLELLIADRVKQNGRDALILRGSAKTTGVVETALYDLDADFTTLLAVDNDLPIRSEQVLREDNAAGINVVREFNENVSNPSANFHDALSAVYRLRTLPLALKSEHTLKVVQNERLYNVELNTIAREKIATTLGAFNAFVVAAQISGDSNFNRYRLEVCISDDERRLPVQIRFRLPGGTVRAELASAQILQPAAPPQTESIAAAPPTTNAAVKSPVVPPVPKTIPPKQYKDNEPLALDLPFTLLERLKFTISRKGQGVGTIVLDVGERKQFFGRDSVQLSAAVTEAVTAGDLFTVGDKIESYISPEQLIPLRSEVRLGGGLGAFNQIVQFNQERGTAASDKNANVEVPVGTHDLLSLAYALRAFQFEFSRNARDVKVAVLLGDVPTVIGLAPVKREQFEIAGRKVPAMHLRVTSGDQRVNALGAQLWLSDDARRLPLRFAMNTPAGEVRADLQVQFTAAAQP